MQADIAFVHDWLATWGGSELVLEAALEILGPAPIHTLVYAPEVFKGSPLAEQEIHASFLQRLPGSRRNHRRYLPLMPLAIEQFDLRGYDLVISSSHAVAHGVLVGPNQLHISYTHTPMRYAWDLYHGYLDQAGLRHGIRGTLAKVLLHYLRLWDLAAAQRVDHFIANSRWVADKIWRVYRREAVVIHPPVDVEDYEPLSPRQEYYITVSRLVPYKRLDLIVEAFSKLAYPLKVLGDGPEAARLKRAAAPNVEFLGWQPREALREFLGRAKAFVYAAEEDFGITPIEAQAAGCPVIAFAGGGVRETVIEGRTGLFFGEQTAEALMKALAEFEAGGFNFMENDLRANAERFSRARFQERFPRYVEQKWQSFIEHRRQIGDPASRSAAPWSGASAP